MLTLAAIAWPLGSAIAQAAPPSGETLRFNQACDASAVVTTGSGDLLVGDDSSNILRAYPASGGDPSAQLDVYQHTAVNKTRGLSYSQIEGAARQGSRLYWIGSHARHESGWHQGDRRRLFALEARPAGQDEQFAPVDGAHKTLHKDMATAPNLKSIGLANSIMYLHRKMPHLAPDKQGLNIGGLAAAKDGEGLLIALRNPRYRNKAIVIPFMNPDRVLAGAANAIFGDPILLDLAGLGIVSMELAAGEGAYYIVAAPHALNLGHKLYRWSGEAADAPALLMDVDAGELRPEAMTVSPDGTRLVLLSDDGHIPVPVADDTGCLRTREADGSCACSFLADPAAKSFRGRWVDIPGAPAPRSGKVIFTP
jgi:hypothetical protein